MSVNPVYDALGDEYLLGGDVDPSVTAVEAPTGSLYIQIGSAKIWQKQDDGETTNWTELAVGDFMERDFSNALSSVNDIDLGGFKIINLADPTSAQHAATKSYVDSADSGKMNTNFSNAANAANAINLGGFQINNVGDPALAQDAATKNYVDSADSGKMNTNFSNATASANDLNLGGFKLINLDDPSDPQDAATKAYVDSIPSGITWATPIDSNITVDTDNAYNLGTNAATLANIYTKHLLSKTNSQMFIATGGSDPIINPEDIGFLQIRTGDSENPISIPSSAHCIELKTGHAIDEESISGQILLATGIADSGITDGYTGNIQLDTGTSKGNGWSGDIILGAGTNADVADNGGRVRLLAIRTRLETGFFQLFKSDVDPAPATPEAGDMYYNTSTNKLRFFNGATWETVTSA